jgi:hypothetical protein
MIITKDTAVTEILNPKYPCDINFAGGTYPSALHACYAAMTNNLNMRSLIAMTPDADQFATDTRLIDERVSIEELWDRVVDIQIQKFSRLDIAAKLDVALDKENDIVVYESLNPVLGKSKDYPSSLDMIGVTTTLIARYGHSKQAIMKRITFGGK